MLALKVVVKVLDLISTKSDREVARITGGSAVQIGRIRKNFGIKKFSVKSKAALRDTIVEFYRGAKEAPGRDAHAYLLETYGKVTQTHTLRIIAELVKSGILKAIGENRERVYAMSAMDERNYPEDEGDEPPCECGHDAEDHYDGEGACTVCQRCRRYDYAS